MSMHHPMWLASAWVLVSRKAGYDDVHLPSTFFVVWRKVVGIVGSKIPFAEQRYCVLVSIIAVFRGCVGY